MPRAVGTFMNYAGKKPPPGQAERREDVVFSDQHNRPVHLVWDTHARGCVGVYPQFRAPWTPELGYVKINADRGFPESIEWDYKTMLEDNRNAWERWFQDLRRFAGKMNGVSATEAYELARKGKWAQVPKALLEECGITPESEDIIKAAMAENSWILGKSDVIPPWAEAWLSLREAQRKRSSMPVTDAELDKFRDDPEDGLSDTADEQYDPEAIGGKTVSSKKPERTMSPKTRRDVRLSGSV